MMKDLTVLAQASALARHAQLRHQLTAENIANANTPGFKARTLPAFEADRVTSPEFRDRIAAKEMFRPIEMNAAQASPDGNTVGLEEQMVLSVDAQGQHKAALEIYRKTMDLMRLAVRAR